MTKRIPTILAIVLVVLGALWSLQGAGYVTGSFMTGEPTWLIVGIVLLVVGLALLTWSLRRGR